MRYNGEYYDRNGRRTVITARGLVGTQKENWRCTAMLVSRSVALFPVASLPSYQWDGSLTDARPLPLLAAELCWSLCPAADSDCMRWDPPRTQTEVKITDFLKSLKWSL